MFRFLNAVMNRPSVRNRRHQRVPIETAAELYFPDRRYGVSGMLIEMSRGGALFREASRYIMDRNRASVVLRFGGHELTGVIVNVRPVGYGILFDELLSEDTVMEIAAAASEIAAKAA